MPKTDSSFDPEDYTPVAERIARFYSTYPTGRIITKLVSYRKKRVIVEATVYRSREDVEPAATGLASEREFDGEINSVACLENTETSAIGRALANLGFQSGKQRPSREEMEKAQRARRRQSDGVQNQVNDELQARADAACDASELLYLAEQHGLSHRRVRAVRERLDNPGVAMSDINRIERGLRGWIDARRADVESVDANKAGDGSVTGNDHEVTPGS